MNSEPLICPFCFSQYPENTYAEEVPVCRECRGYGRSILLEPRSEFRQNVRLPQVQAVKETWQKRVDFLEVERRMVLDNLDVLIKQMQDEG